MNKDIMDKYIKIGQIVNTHALKGDLKVNMYTENLDDIKKYSYIYLDLDDKKEKFEIEKIRFSKKQVLLKLKNINHINDAEKLKDKYIYINEEQLLKNNPLQDNEYYIKDLIGLNVLDQEGINIGKITEVLELNTDVYIVKNKEGKEILIPAIKRFIKKVNIKEKKMIVELGGLDEI